MKKKLIGLGVVVCALGMPALALAQQQVIPVAWRDDGNLVIEVRDELGSGEGLEWAQGSASTDFYAVCTPGALGTASWDSGCTVCLQDASAGGPAACGLDKLKKWPKALKTNKKSPNKKIAISDKRKCVDGADGKECTSTIAVGKLGTVPYTNSNPKLKPAISAFFRKDSNAVLLMVNEESQSDEAIRTDSFLLLDLTPAGGTGKAGGGTFLQKWQQVTDKVCACKTMECVNGLTQELTDLANQAGTEAANMSPEDMQKLQDAVMKMSDCMSKLAGGQQP